MSKKTVRVQEEPARKARRQRTDPWKGIYGTDRKYTRRWNAATERELERVSRTVEEQLALLDERLGPGKGAQKERNRLVSYLSGKFGGEDDHASR